MPPQQPSLIPVALAIAFAGIVIAVPVIITAMNLMVVTGDRPGSDRTGDGQHHSRQPMPVGRHDCNRPPQMSVCSAPRSQRTGFHAQAMVQPVGGGEPPPGFSDQRGAAIRERLVRFTVRVRGFGFVYRTWVPYRRRHCRTILFAPPCIANSIA